jgi:cold-inducible RNA-binding protein
MATKLFVGGLPYSVTDDQLRELFAAVGKVESAKVIMDRETNRSKGFGFVEMGSDQEAQDAVKQMNGKEVEGRTITVNEARPQQPRSFGGGFGGNNNYRDNNRGGNRY